MSEIYYCTLTKQDSDGHFFIDIPLFICEQIEFLEESDFFVYCWEKPPSSEVEFPNDNNSISDKYGILIVPYNQKESFPNVYIIEFLLANTAGSTAAATRIISNLTNAKKEPLFNIYYCKAVDAMYKNTSRVYFEVLVKTNGNRRLKLEGNKVEEELKAMLNKAADDLVKSEKEEKRLLKKFDGTNYVLMKRVYEEDLFETFQNISGTEAISLKSIRWSAKKDTLNFIAEKIELNNEKRVRITFNKFFSEIYKERIFPTSLANKNLILFTTLVVDPISRHIKVFFKDPFELVVSFYFWLVNKPGKLIQLLNKLTILELNLKVINPFSIKMEHIVFQMSAGIGKSRLSYFSVKTLERIINTVIKAEDSSVKSNAELLELCSRELKECLNLLSWSILKKDTDGKYELENNFILPLETIFIQRLNSGIDGFNDEILTLTGYKVISEVDDGILTDYSKLLFGKSSLNLNKQKDTDLYIIDDFSNSGYFKQIKINPHSDLFQGNPLIHSLTEQNGYIIINVFFTGPIGNLKSLLKEFVDSLTFDTLKSKELFDKFLLKLYNHYNPTDIVKEENPLRMPKTNDTSTKAGKNNVVPSE